MQKDNGIDVGAVSEMVRKTKNRYTLFVIIIISCSLLIFFGNLGVTSGSCAAAAVFAIVFLLVRFNHQIERMQKSVLKDSTNQIMEAVKKNVLTEKAKVPHAGEFPNLSSNNPQTGGVQ